MRRSARLAAVCGAGVFLLAGAAVKAGGASSAGVSSAAVSGAAVVPQLMKFSGTLEDLAGKPITGTVEVTFSLYEEQTGGSALWHETQVVTPDAAGRYTVLLGIMHRTGLPMELFTSGKAHWLGVEVEDLPEQARVLLVSVPYALKAGDAETLGGKPASDYLLASGVNTAVITSTGGASAGGTGSGGAGKQLSSQTKGPLVSTPCTPTADGGGAANEVALYSGPCALTEDANFVDVNGKVGIGTAAPAYTLDIAGMGADLGTSIAVGDYVGTNTYGYAQGSYQLRNAAYNGGAGKEIFAFGAEGDLASNGAVTASDFYIYNTAGTASYKAVFQGGNGKIAFGNSIADPSSLSGAALTIDSTGNVGIGTSAPAATLEVNGTAQFDSTVNFAQPITTSGVDTFTGSTTTGGVVNATQSGSGAAATLTNSSTGDILDANNGSGSVFKIGNSGGITSSALVTTPSVTDRSTPNCGTSPNCVSANVLGGFMGATGGNSITAGVTGATIGGGGGTLRGFAVPNSVTDDWGTVGGGLFNTAGNGTGTVSDAIAATVAGGEGNTAGGNQATVAGGGANTASGLEATVAGGYGNTASGGRATVAGGYGNTAGGNFSFAAGCDAVAAKDGSFVWSGYNGTACTSVASTADGQFLIFAPGNVGIGTATPGEPLDVVGNIRTSTCFLAGSTDIGGTCSSDARLKTNIRPFIVSLDQLAELRPVRFNWRASNPVGYRFGPDRATGLIAQQVKQVFPSMVGTDKNGYYTVNYSMLPLMLLQGVRELKARNDSLTFEVQAQRRQIAQARAQIAKLDQATAAKDAEVAALAAQNRTLASEVAQLQKAQEKMMAVVERLDSSRRGNDAAAASRPARAEGHVRMARARF